MAKIAPTPETAQINRFIDCKPTAFRTSVYYRKAESCHHGSDEHGLSMVYFLIVETMVRRKFVSLRIRCLLQFGFAW